MKKVQQKSRLRLFFMRGIASLLPTILTIAILVICYRFVRDNIAAPINHSIHRVLVNTSFGRHLLEKYGGLRIDLENLRYQQSPSTDWKSFRKGDTDLPDREKLTGALNKAIHPVLGFLLALMLMFVVASLFATYVGRRIFLRFERMLSKFPIIKVIYPYAKQVVDFFFKEKKMDFSTVVALEYPRKGVWAIGFMTGHGLRQLHQASGVSIVSVFIPSSPAPMTGYTVFIPRADVIPLEIDVEEAFRLVITGGVVVPDAQVVAIPADLAEEAKPRRRPPAKPSGRGPDPKARDPKTGDPETRRGRE